MTIKFVNHSCFIVEHNGVSIITDPWLEGSVFNNGWLHLSKTQFKYEDFQNVDYIWFSHEHPDHFYPPNLKKIPAEIKKNITVLFQNTIDGRVANYCRKAGFKEVIELHKGQTFELAKDFSVQCEYFDEGDSWVGFRVGDKTILNTNDCAIEREEQATRIKELFPKVDILMCQFSYAYWAGNTDDVAYRKQVAADKLKFLKLQCEIFEPKVTIPIASYIYFCHDENFYLNDSINTAATTYQFLKENTKTTPVILYNGDNYTYPENWDSTRSIERYTTDLAQIREHPEELIKNVPVTVEELKAQAVLFIDNLKKTNSFLVKSVLKDARIHLSDHNKTFVLSLNDHLIEREVPRDECDVAMSSESLMFCMKFPYGTDTTQINGRLQKPKNGNYTRFYNIFRVDQQKMRGQEMTLGYLSKVLVNKVKAKLR